MSEDIFDKAALRAEAIGQRKRYGPPYGIEPDTPEWFKDVYGSLSDEPDQRKIKYLWAEVSRHLDGTQIRIEALRAAVTIVAGNIATGRDITYDGNPVSPPEVALLTAKEFAAYLENGE